MYVTIIIYASASNVGFFGRAVLLGERGTSEPNKACKIEKTYLLADGYVILCVSNKSPWFYVV